MKRIGASRRGKQEHATEPANSENAKSGLQQYTPPSFNELMQPVRHRKQFIYGVIIETIHDLFVLLTVALALWVPLNRAVNARRESIASIQAAQEMAKWPRGRVVKEYHDALGYNKTLADSGQLSLGELVDPFQNDINDDSSSAGDKTYQSMLTSSNGVMGTIRIPKISLRLPIYHGTAQGTLSQGVGHLHGSSLPVGGKSSNAVLTGHRGLAEATLFTRLDELGKGDNIYIQTLNRTMGYRVISIHVVKPDDTHLYRVVNGKDLVTLMTCTPYGVNTERLVITAKRGNIPKTVPVLTDQPDPKLVAGFTAAGVFLVGLAFVLTRNYRLLVPPPWHYDGTPIPRWRLLPHRPDRRGLPPMGEIPAHPKHVTQTHSSGPK
ncbi:class C sortase [Bifidobacterium sp. ESL0690]|uniref:class C sortase n=1 Tax=Bifidobacterium sp. ESL0690 TaxID=2983214 RepID=UPI0023F9E8DF|nr:class C sortase [Bifidobacterium sp. ESL0690]WEV47807.1 class C sortase [Bifidobacterium sp. ESL0690]